MTTSITSSHNPFRSPASTPQTTGTSPGNTTGTTTTTTTTTGERTGSAAAAAAADPIGLNEEPPPAYTPSPDVYQGEETIQYGPRRPFQSGPPPPQQQHQHHQLQHHQPQQQYRPPPGAPLGQSHTGINMNTSTGTSSGGSLWRQLTGQLAASLSNIPSSSSSSSSWTAYPGVGRQEVEVQYPHNNTTQPGQGQSNHHLRVPAPPRHPSTSNPTLSLSLSPPSSAGTNSGSSPTSDFARDFYAAGTGPETTTLSSSPPQSRSAPASPKTYAPPPGPPPSSSSSSPLSSSSASHRRHSTTHREGRDAPRLLPRPDTGGEGDERPTDTPVPGHPLLRAGKLLVYPRGYVCEKCNNTGYKHSDPSHPCKKCWPKYAKPFQGPLVYAFSAPVEDTTLGGSSVSFQRALPDWRPPRHLASPSGAGAPPTSPLRYRAPAPPAPPAPPGAYGYPSPHAPAPHAPPRQIHTLSPYTPPPPGAVVYAAGDPRIGGSACWNCAGRGVVGFLVFEEGCVVCGGVGRVF